MNDDDLANKLRAITDAELQKIADATESADDIPDIEEIIRRNCVGSEAGSIYRHYECKYLQEDLEHGIITLINPSEKTQLDPLENPVGGDDFAKQYSAIKAIMGDFFASSWSTDSDIDMPKDGDSVVIEVCPRELLRGIIEDDNRIGIISYHIREILYRDEGEIRRSLQSETWEDLVDSTGLLLVQSVMTLNEDFQDENEVRVVYFDHENDASKRNGDLYKHPCDWRNLVKGYEFHPDNNDAWPDLDALLKDNLRT